MFFGVGKVMDEIQKSGMMDSLDKAFKQMGDSMNKAVKILEEVKDTTNKQ
jgi:ribosomal protein L19